MNRISRNALLILLVAAVAACSKEASPARSTAEPSKPTIEAPQVPEAALQPEVDTGNLGGTSWRLVKIMSMDDNTYVPDDPSLYTLEFGADGTASLLADCNRGSGTWTSESDSQLRFGPIAATMAMCPPESLHDRYMAQFEWVRSYVMRDGHLFLATMADGAIIEFEPVSGD